MRALPGSFYERANCNRKDKISEFCKRNPIRRLSIFGSVLRDDFTQQSDVDMLLELVPDADVGYFKLIAMENELSAILGRKVDLRTPQELSHYFRAEVLSEAELLYEQA